MRRITSSWTPVVLSVSLLLALASCSSSTEEQQGSGSGETGVILDHNQVSTSTGAAGGAQSDFQDAVTQQAAIAERRRVMAADAVKRGDLLTQDGRLQEALEAYADAIRIDPSNADAQRGFDQVSSVLGGDAAARIGEAGRSFDEGVARKQQADILSRNAMNLGMQLMEQGRYDDAIVEFEKALTIRKLNVLVDNEFDEAKIRSAIENARARSAQSEREAEAARLREIEAINAGREDDERKAAEARIQALFRQAEDEFKTEKYDACIKTCERILDADPTNQEALQIREVAKRMRHHRTQHRTMVSYREEWVKALDEVTALARPQVDREEFPSLRRWQEIESRGAISISRGATTVSEVDRDVMRALEETKLSSVDWTEKTLDEAMRFVSVNTRTNIVVMKAVDAVAPEEERLLNLQFEEISARAAIDLAVSQIEGLAWVVDDGQVKITTKEQARKRKVLEYYDVRDLTQQIKNFPGIDFNLFPSGAGGGAASFDDFGGEDDENFSLFDADRLIELVRSTIDAESWADDADNTIENNNGTLVVNQTPESHRKIAALLADLRKGIGMQVRIESRFITVENNFLQDIGVDIRGLGDDSGGVGVPGVGQNAPFDDFGTPGSASSRVLGTDNSAGATYSVGGGDGAITGRAQNLFSRELGNPDVLTGTGGFSLQYTFVDDTQLEAILRAVQKFERVNLVTAPSLLVANTQRGNLQISNQVTYVKDYDVEIAQAAVIADPIVDVVREGVTLDVRPIVSNDRRFITLEMRPTVATLVRPFRTFSSSLGIGTAVTIEVPELRKESLKTTVVMPDGGTLLIGGLKFYEEENQDSGVPVLKDIPLIGLLFSRKGKYTNVRDLIVLLKAEIVILEEREPTAG